MSGTGGLFIHGDPIIRGREEKVMKKRAISFFLALLMAVTLLGNGIPAYAQETENPVIATEETINKVTEDDVSLETSSETSPDAEHEQETSENDSAGEETIEKGIPGDETPGDEARTEVETEEAAERTEEISATGNQLGDSEILELEETEEAPNTATPSEATPQPPLLAPLAPVDEPLTDVWVHGTEGTDSNDGTAPNTPVLTLDKALELLPDGGTIHLAGTFSGLSKTIPAGITLEIWENTTITGPGSGNGITLASGSSLSCTNGASLSMSNYATALTIAKGAELNDGHYEFTNNVTNGIKVLGSVSGSAGKDDIVIVANDKSNTNFYTSTASFENCTLDVTSQTRTWFDATDLTMTNASMTLSGFGMGYYINTLTMTDSELVMKSGGGGSFFGIQRDSTGATIQGSKDCTITNSRLEFDYGGKAGLSIGLQSNSAEVTFQDSDLVFKNGGTGGLNLNKGIVRLLDSSISGDGGNSGALFGVQSQSPHSQLWIEGNSLVDSPAQNNYDTGASQLENAYIVLGGSHHVKYVPNYNSSYGSTVPVNGEANGNEKLFLFTLSDSSVDELSPINLNGDAYTYSVGRATSDGEKHVWVPKATATFVLNNPNAAFADGTTANRSIATIRGYALPAVKGNVDAGAPASSQNGEYFKRWYYVDAAGEKQTFSYDATALTQDMTVLAEWTDVPPVSPYIVSFETNGGAAIAPVSMTPGDSIDLTQYVPNKTNAQGQANIFLGWYTDMNFAPAAKQEGVYTPQADTTLYAKWDLHPDPVAQTLPILGDILVQKAGMSTFDTEHLDTYKVQAGDTLNYKATINASQTKGYLDMLRDQLLSGRPWLTVTRPGDQITLKNMSSRFTVVITPDETLSFPADPQAYVLNDGCFDITDVEKAGDGTITITMDLNTTGLAVFADLYDALESYLDLLTLDIRGVQVSTAAQAGDLLTTMGEVSGRFSAIAVSPKKVPDGNPHPEQSFDFGWFAVQDHQIPGTGEDGTDFIYANAVQGDVQLPQIALTVEVEEPTAPPVHPPISMDAKIEGDILVQHPGDAAFDTEHDAVFQTKTSATLHYRATIDGSVVRQQLDTLKGQLLANRPWLSDQREGDKIALENMSSQFQAVVTPDPRLTFPTELASYTFAGGPFVLTSVVHNGDGTITATMDLNTEGLDTFADLYDALYPVLDCLSLTVNGVKVSDHAQEGDRLTTKGAVSGNFDATAVSPIGPAQGNPHQTQAFHFTWTAEQDHNIPGAGVDGLDHILKDSGDTTSIWLTVEVKKDLEPPVPPTEEKVGSLMVTKTVSGSGGDQNKEFTFTVTLDKQDLNGQYGDMTFTGGVATFTLKHDQSKTANGLPTGVSYTVEESDNSGYTVTKTNAAGTIQTGITATAAFENYKGSSGGSGGSGGNSGGDGGGSSSHTPQAARVTLTATKTMDGLIPTGSGFTFFLDDANGQRLQVKNNQGGNITFDTLTFNKTGSYVYYLTEQTGNDKNINYDTASYKVTVTVTCPYDYAASVSYEKNGHAYNSVPAFANTTKPSAPAPTPTQTPSVVAPARPLDKVPKTEDSSNLALWGILAAASLLSLTVLLAGTKTRKARSQSKEHQS